MWFEFLWWLWICFGVSSYDEHLSSHSTMKIDPFYWQVMVRTQSVRCVVVLGGLLVPSSPWAPDVYHPSETPACLPVRGPCTGYDRGDRHDHILFETTQVCHIDHSFWAFYFTGPMVVPMLFTLRFALNAALLHTLIWEEWVCIQYCSKMRARVCNLLLYAYCQLFLIIPTSFDEHYFMNYLTYNTGGYIDKYQKPLRLL